MLVSEFTLPGGDVSGRGILLLVLVALAEIDILKGRVDAVAAAVFKEQGKKVKYLVGTMIELPRAALRAAEIAETAEFFSKPVAKKKAAARKAAPKAVAAVKSKWVYLRHATSSGAGGQGPAAHAGGRTAAQGAACQR